MAETRAQARAQAQAQAGLRGVGGWVWVGGLFSRACTRPWRLRVPRWSVAAHARQQPHTTSTINATIAIGPASVLPARGGRHGSGVRVQREKERRGGGTAFPAGTDRTPHGRSAECPLRVRCVSAPSDAAALDSLSRSVVASWALQCPHLHPVHSSTTRTCCSRGKEGGTTGVAGHTDGVSGHGLRI